MTTRSGTRAREVLPAIRTIHVLKDAAERPVCRQWISRELRRHRCSIGSGTLYPLFGRAIARRGRLHMVDRRRRALEFALLVSLALAVPAAHAGPPFLTDDPEPVDERHWEAYVFSTYDHPQGTTQIQGPALEVNVGAAPELQLHLVVPWAWMETEEAPWGSGLGDVEAGLKLRLVDEIGRRPQIGIFPLVELPTGDASRGLGNGHVWFRLPIWVQKSWGPWTTYGGGGWVINRAPGQRDHPFAGWLLQRALGEKVTLGGEVFSHGAEVDGGRGSTIANIGGNVNPTPKLSLLFSVGKSVSGERHTVGYLGLYWTWGPGRRDPDLPTRNRSSRD